MDFRPLSKMPQTFNVTNPIIQGAVVAAVAVAIIICPSDIDFKVNIKAMPTNSTVEITEGVAV
eukprot:15336552-Ditylum_brightwellii.AAC.1